MEIVFRVTYNGIVVSASLAEMAFQKMSDIKMSAILGYPVCPFSVLFLWNKKLVSAFPSMSFNNISFLMISGGSSCE